MNTVKKTEAPSLGIAASATQHELLLAILYNLFTLETSYSFQCEGGPLQTCGDWLELKHGLGELVKERRESLRKQDAAIEKSTPFDLAAATYKVAFEEYDKRTEWVKQREHWPSEIRVLGEHRADVVNQYVQLLERKLASVLIEIEKAEVCFSTQIKGAITKLITETLGEDVLRNRKFQPCGNDLTDKQQENVK